MRYFFLVLILFTTIGLSSQSRNDSIYTSVDSFPQYPGGDFEMYQHIRDYIELRAPVFRLERLSQKNYYAIADVVLDKDGLVSAVKLDGRSQDYYLLEEIYAAFRSMPKSFLETTKGWGSRLKYGTSYPDYCCASGSQEFIGK